MAIYELKKTKTTWYVMRNGEAWCGFNTKKAAVAAMEKGIKFEKELEKKG